MLCACGGGSSTPNEESDVSESGKVKHCKEYVIEELNTIERDDRAYRDLNTSRHLINALNRAEYFLNHYSHDLNCLARDIETSLLMTIDSNYMRNLISTLQEKTRRLIESECRPSPTDYERRLRCKALKDSLN